MSNKWLIIGISGVTCGGKTTIANKLNQIIPSSRVINQDDYFLPVEDEKHVWIPELNHINFDIITSLDMEKMYNDIQDISENTCKKITRQKSQEFSLSSEDLQIDVVQQLRELQLNVLILEGFSIFICQPIERLCELKYFTTLSKEECFKRRKERVYEPPDCPGYFEQCVWPEYLKQFKDIKNVKNMRYISEFTEDPVKIILNDIMQSLVNLSESL